MNPQGFSFPPPPPPPPTQQHQSHQQQYPHNAGFTQYGGQAHHGQRGGRGGGGHFRGRGRGYGNRGGGRGSHFLSSDASRPGAYTSAPPSVGYGPMTYPTYPQPQGISTPHFTPSSTQSFQTAQNPTPYASPRPFSQTPAVPGPPYQRQPSYDTAYTASTPQHASPYPRVATSHQPHPHHTPQSVQPAMMGPPMRWGFETAGAPAPFRPRPFTGYGSQTSPGERPMKHAGKRDHSSAFGKPQPTAPRTAAPPAVPSFGNPLPSKPPPPADVARKAKKKKRKYNQLGLTPKTEEHESSEEDDVDEELKLAPGGGSSVGPLQVTYKGQTSNLQTPAEIAAWIQERKKRFPTQAKIDAKKKAVEEAKKAREEAQQQNESRKQLMKREKKGQERRGHKVQQEDSADPLDAAARAKRKADKLRRKLMKEEKRIAQAEADAERARIKVEETQKESTNVDESQTQTTQTQTPQASGGVDAASNSEIHLEYTPRVSSDIAAPFEPKSKDGDQAALEADGDLELSEWSSESENSDWTSSSGSDLSSSDSEGSDDDSPPEQATSRREGPERLPPPPREAKKRVCRHFARTGRCLRGNKCKFLHERPDRGAKTKPVEQKGRKRLLQALLDRQKEDENRRVMEVIMWLGENGLLEEPKIHGDPHDDAPMITSPPQCETDNPESNIKRDDCS